MGLFLCVYQMPTRSQADSVETKHVDPAYYLLCLTVQYVLGGPVLPTTLGVGWRCLHCALRACVSMLVLALYCRCGNCSVVWTFCLCTISVLHFHSALVVVWYSCCLEIVLRHLMEVYLWQTVVLFFSCATCVPLLKSFTGRMQCNTTVRCLWPAFSLCYAFLHVSMLLT